MLRAEQIEARFKEIRHLITTIPESPNRVMYIKHLESIREALNKEYIKAIGREERPYEEPETYSHSNPRTGKNLRGAYDIY